MTGNESARGSGPGERGGPYRIMVVDDSAVVRGLVTRFLEQDKDIKVVASVGNGQRALDTLARTRIDVVVLDIEMPVMDGLTALPKLLQVQPGVQVIMSSTLTKQNAEVSLRALQSGAADYVTKPSTGGLHNAEAFQRELSAKVKAVGSARRKASGESLPDGRPARETAPERGSGAITAIKAAKGATPVLRRSAATLPPHAIAIGSSTGGPQALFKVLSALGPVSQPIFITQHMPATFTALLADHISRQAKQSCAEAADGMPVSGGSVYVARGGQHLVARREQGAVKLHLSDGEPENFCRPSVNPMLRSLVEIYGGRLLTVILTGMGSDGLLGCEAVVQAGGQVIAQDEETSVVWGMPGAVAKAGLCSAILPLDQIAEHVRRIAGRPAA